MATTKPELDDDFIAKLTAQITAQVKAQMAEEMKQEASKKKRDPLREEQHKRDNERVQITLFRDGKEYKDDVYVAVNGENCLIKRGQPVWVKRKFVKVYEQSLRQQTAANEYAESMHNEYVNGAMNYIG